MNQLLLSDAPDASNALSLCIGLGPEAERLLTALRAQMQTDAAIGGLVAQSGTDPAVVDAWSSETPPYPYVLVVLVIDARDRQARDMSQFWAARLSPIGYLRAALVIGDSPATAEPSWRQALSAHFDGVIDLCPQHPLMRRMAALSLSIGLLFLNRSLIGYDAADVREILRLGSQARSAATVWSRPERCPLALQRVWHRLQPRRIQGAMAFLHGSVNMSLKEFDRLGDHLRQRMPEDAYILIAWFPHPEWPDGRRGLELMLVGNWGDTPLATTPGWVAGLRQKVAEMPDDEEYAWHPVEPVVADVDSSDIPFFLRPARRSDNQE
ncbi:hypothetical protein [Thiocystis violacea]|uniref:hypothetical protein n=1 Tax=Thiocystis violacea TaxID=13725 RepID=UPI0019041ED2|nr:hypothetical protein [Thiocystis violacea]MBK1718662.1 hypothetical protein [Thiocystis violacea]